MNWTAEHAKEATAGIADRMGAQLLADGLPKAAHRLEVIADEIRDDKDRKLTTDPVALVLFDALVTVANADDQPENDAILDGLMGLLRHLEGDAR